MLKFKGCQNFRQRLLCSTLSGRPIRIDNIRAEDENPGLRDFEASFLRLLEKLTNGCSVEINETGNMLTALTAQRQCSKFRQVVDSLHLGLP